jgi:hypothetical protein
MRANDDLDLRLDAALATYADAESRPELPAQVMAAIRQGQGVGPRRAWLGEAIAVPACVVLLLAAIAAFRHEAARPATPAPMARVEPPRLSSPVLANPPVLLPSRDFVRPKRAAMHASAAMPLHKLDVFPTPAPLSAPEQALAALVHDNPGNISQSVAASQRLPIAPLDIAAIKIPALDPPNKDGN